MTAISDDGRSMAGIASAGRVVRDAHVLRRRVRLGSIHVPRAVRDAGFDGASVPVGIATTD